jgi:hypothetical protein
MNAQAASETGKISMPVSVMTVPSGWVSTRHLAPEIAISLRVNAESVHDQMRIASLNRTVVEASTSMWVMMPMLTPEIRVRTMQRLPIRCATGVAVAAVTVSFSEQMRACRSVSEISIPRTVPTRILWQQPRGESFSQKRGKLLLFGQELSGVWGWCAGCVAV